MSAAPAEGPRGYPAELTIQDWTWSQVPPPLLSVVTQREHVVIGMADPANGVYEDGSLAWIPRRLTPDQADQLADDLHARAAAIRGGAS